MQEDTHTVANTCDIDDISSELRSVFRIQEGEIQGVDTVNLNANFALVKEYWKKNASKLRTDTAKRIRYDENGNASLPDKTPMDCFQSLTEDLKGEFTKLQNRIQNFNQENALSTPELIQGFEKRNMHILGLTVALLSLVSTSYYLGKMVYKITTL